MIEDQAIRGCATLDTLGNEGGRADLWFDDRTLTREALFEDALAECAGDRLTQPLGR